MQNEKISEKKTTTIKNNLVIKNKDEIEFLKTDGKKLIEGKHNSKNSDW
jgi:hypothetical protein